MKLILASGSPRRRELLEQAGLTFTVWVPDVDEDIQGLPPEQTVAALARKKAEAAVSRWKQEAPCVILAADTLVSVNGAVLGKPEDREDARAMLRTLSGQRHSVYTGVCLAFVQPRQTTYTEEVCQTQVKFKSVSDAEIDQYLRSDEALDKAGGYAIQGEGVGFVDTIDGDYDNVVGLPVKRVLALLSQAP